MKENICNYIKTVVEGSTTEQLIALMETPPEEAMGDFALPCFAFAKTLRKLVLCFYTNVRRFCEIKKGWAKVHIEKL